MSNRNLYLLCVAIMMFGVVGGGVQRTIQGSWGMLQPQGWLIYILSIMTSICVAGTIMLERRNTRNTYKQISEVFEARRTRDERGYLKAMDWKAVAALEHEHGYAHLPESLAACGKTECLQSWIDETPIDDAVPELMRLTTSGIISTNELRQLVGDAPDAVKLKLTDSYGRPIFRPEEVSPKTDEEELKEALKAAVEAAKATNARADAIIAEQNQQMEKPWQAVRPAGRRLNMDGSVDLIGQKDFMGFNIPDKRIHEATPLRSLLVVRATESAYGKSLEKDDSVVFAESEFEKFELPNTYRGLWLLMRQETDWIRPDPPKKADGAATFDIETSTHSMTFDEAPEVTPIYTQGDHEPKFYRVTVNGATYQFRARHLMVHKRARGFEVTWSEPLSEGDRRRDEVMRAKMDELDAKFTATEYKGEIYPDPDILDYTKMQVDRDLLTNNPYAIAYNQGGA